MSGPKTTLQARLNIETLDRDLFRGYPPADGRPWIFGGLVAAQALMAALRTVPEPLLAHSLHAYFVLKGDPSRPILYQVERIRDGASFVTRQIEAIQEGRVLFSMSASFKRDEPGMEHQDPMPDVPPPESVPSMDEVLEGWADRGQIFSMYNGWERPIVVHDLDLIDPAEPRIRTGPHNVWWKTRDPLPDDPRLHQCALAYASDLTMAEAALHRHGRSWLERDMVVVSIDHSIWFHRPIRADDWVLYTSRSPSAQAGRGLSLGSAYAKDGQLVATVAQEALMRQRRRRD